MSDPQPDRDDFSEAVVAAFIHDHLDTFPKRDVVDFFAGQPDAVVTLPELEAKVKTDRFILIRQVQELKELGVLAYHYADEHTRVWHLAATEWARQIVGAVVAHWAKYPAKRDRIVHHGKRTFSPRS